MKHPDSISFKRLPLFAAFVDPTGETFVKVGHFAAVSAVDGTRASPYAQYTQVTPAQCGVFLPHTPPVDTHKRACYT